jgi:hypothetical protein
MPETSPEKSALPPVDTNAIFSTFLSVLKAPADFFKNMKEQKGFTGYLVFSVAMCLVGSVLTAVFPIVHGVIVPAIINIVIYTVVGGIAGPFIGAFIIWGICLAFGSKATWEKAFPISAYAMAVQPISGLLALVAFVSPGIAGILSLVVWLYSLYICFVGAKARMFEAAPEAKPAA